MRSIRDFKMVNQCIVNLCNQDY